MTIESDCYALYQRQTFFSGGYWSLFRRKSENETLTQAEDRLHRIGQRDTVLVQHIVLDNSLDADMVDKIICKQKVVAAVLQPRPKTSERKASNKIAFPPDQEDLCELEK